MSHQTRLKRRSRRLASGGGGDDDVEMAEARADGAVPGERQEESRVGSKRSRVQEAHGQAAGREKSPKRRAAASGAVHVGREREGGGGGRKAAAAHGKGKQRRDGQPFKGCCFVLSRALETGLAEKVAEVLRQRGASVAEEMEEQAAAGGRWRRFFVQDSNSDDDGRLPQALECGYEVVGVDYINDCVAHGRLLSPQEQALGMDLCARRAARGDRGTVTAASSVQEKNEACLMLPEEVFDGVVHEPVPPENREWDNCPQSFNDFLAMPQRIVSGPLRSTIYLQPLGWNTKAVAKGAIPRSLSLLEEAMAEFLSIFFACPVARLEERSILLDDSNPSGTVEYCVRWEDYMYPIGCSPLAAEAPGQPGPSSAAVGRAAGARAGRVDRLHAVDVLQVLWEQKMPQNTLAVLALTMHDLFEVRDDRSQYWGRATGDGFAIASGFRFIPPQISVSRQFREVAQAAAVGGQAGLSGRRSLRAGKGKEQCPIKAACGISRKELARFLNVAAHELCHVFGIDHCSYYKCLMNSCKPDPAELDGTLHLCVICLRKLQSAVDLQDLIGRYERLLAFLQKHGLAKEAEWFHRRLAGIFGNPQPPSSDIDKTGSVH